MVKSEIINDKFNCLVDNALNFLDQSIIELENKPKFSVIHFHAAIELFLKARLMAEHWSLVISSKKEADWIAFKKGDFVSVSLEESVRKLDKIVQSSINVKALDIFRKITSHRNQMVHFYHASETTEEQGLEVQKIVMEQFIAWYYLHDLLLKQWKDTFSGYSEKIHQIGYKLKKHHLFLKVKYEELKPQITELKISGHKCLECPSCHFESNIHVDIKDKTYESECLVCDLNQFCLVIACDNCSNGEVRFQGEPHAECNQCGHLFGKNDLEEKFVDAGAAYIAMKDGVCDYFPINCGSCSGYKTVVEITENNLLCIECFDVPHSYGNCEWCNEQSTNLREHSYLTGCEFCEGHIGWNQDD